MKEVHLGDWIDSIECNVVEDDEGAAMITIAFKLRSGETLNLQRQVADTAGSWGRALMSLGGRLLAADERLTLLEEQKLLSAYRRDEHDK